MLQEKDASVVALNPDLRKHKSKVPFDTFASSSEKD
jgi:hypothetical protein